MPPLLRNSLLVVTISSNEAVHSRLRSRQCETRARPERDQSEIKHRPHLRGRTTSNANHNPIYIVMVAMQEYSTGAIDAPYPQPPTANLPCNQASRARFHSRHRSLPATLVTGCELGEGNQRNENGLRKSLPSLLPPNYPYLSPAK
ncbi:hypothetical protein AJ78_06300 [Emergomyces pasteurianus Ep9510]|uniref:Uncharacterized protein n=1 Tax=Emergomyces pasteurianus Ep9510 TaxID=1447872 RepID=A0A1J9PB91_9EURO|nr:hypothetical protein AJ78_06300 [Emergomyces pasteurianus Ep9510]